MITISFTAGHSLSVASPRPKGDGATGAVAPSTAPRNTGVTTF